MNNSTSIRNSFLTIGDTCLTVSVLTKAIVSFHLFISFLQVDLNDVMNLFDVMNLIHLMDLFCDS